MGKKNNLSSEKKMKKIAQAVLDKNAETKRREFEYDALAPTNITDIAAAPIDQNLTSIGGGTGLNGRIGNVIRLTNLSVKLLIEAHTASAVIRCIVYRPRKGVDNFTAAGGPTYDVYQTIDKDRYTILYDSRFGVSTTNGKLFHNVNFFKSFGSRGALTTYNGNGAGNLVSGGTWLYLVSNVNAINYPTMDGNVVLKYRDI